ncbi:MAG: hypothetical protein HC809_04655 [Gammaproteobacteria bacterium]|nr:hypothetical protein [Gammaproteobacteria bacterium]
MTSIEEQEEVAVFLSRISNPRHQDVVRMALQGFVVAEIASECNYSAVRVRQILRSIAEQHMGTT